MWYLYTYLNCEHILKLKYEIFHHELYENYVNNFLSVKSSWKVEDSLVHKL